jgi:4a-hydroxytetrahydrobiopterin dehydratase
MQIDPFATLTTKKCEPCEGGVEPCSLGFAKDQIREIPHWKLSQDGKWIRRSIRFKDFVRTVACLDAVGELAESEGHHPDLHITGYRHLQIDLSTHAIGGLSQNDFILAAKIDQLLSESFPDLKNNE